MEKKVSCTTALSSIIDIRLKTRSAFAEAFHELPEVLLRSQFDENRERDRGFVTIDFKSAKQLIHRIPSYSYFTKRKIFIIILRSSRAQ